ncbi:MAG: sigma-70 family RNA polymerase sigma factor [Proteobacteria bacterium]|nr:sigma-70 family RNA polymerase sigma factor [Pseudomonadota bacterium]
MAHPQHQPTEHETLDVLMRRALAGDNAAYALALTQMARLARAVVGAKIQHPETQEDVVQDILLSVHQARHTWDGERPFKPWFYAIALYRMLDSLRSHYRNREDTLDDPALFDTFAAPVTETGGISESLDRALKSLPERQRQIVMLMKVQGFSAQEVAVRLGMSVSAVKVAAHRAYKQLRDVLESEDE